MPDAAPREDTTSPSPHAPVRTPSRRPRRCMVELDQRTPPTSCARHRPPAPMPPPRLVPRTHAAPAHPACRNGPSTHVLLCTQYVPGNKIFCICQPCARNSGNKIAASVHGMGSGCLAVDAMVIQCLGVDRRVERFFILNHFPKTTWAQASPMAAWL
jgi:hypothetical protein